MAKRRRRPPPRVKRGGKLRWPWMLGLLAVLGTGAAFWMIWPFWQLAAQFGTEPQKQPSRLFGRPPELRVGDPMTTERLVEKLEAKTYERVGSLNTMGPGTFRAVEDGLEIHRRRFPAPQGLEGGDRLRVTLGGGTLKALAAETGAGLSAVRLDPPQIASYYGPDLRERRPAGLDELPEDLVLAVLAAEDASFLAHKGVSLRSTVRAAWVNLTSREVRQGGSTLTQQLVKNLYLTPEKTLIRKIREAVLAVMLEIRYEKRAILEAYLNEIYWGRSGTVHLMGVGAAAWAYFGKHPSRLSLAESALLAGMIQSPARYSPLKHPAAAKERRDAILGRLAQLRWVAPERLARAAQIPVTLAQGPLKTRQAPYFADFVAGESRRRFGIDELADAGYVLHSTLSAGDQRHAEEAVRWGVEALEKGWEKGRKAKTPLESALVSVDPRDGGILAYVGGRDYARSQFDRVTLARRQPGSAIKPIVFAAAFEQRTATTATLLDDSSLTLTLDGREWSPGNYDGEFRGPVTARAALERSLNVPTARLALDLGLGHVVDLARRMGLGGRLEPYPSLALGAAEVTPLELATVYSVFAAGGLKPTLHALVGVRDRQGQRVPGLPLPEPERVLGEDVSYLVTGVLQGVLDRGTGRGARKQGLEGPLAGKTGTTNDRRDSWFAGYSPARATLVWVGYDDNSQTRLSGARAALPIWTRFSYKVRPADGYRDFARPEGLVRALVDPTTGGLATNRCFEIVEEVFLSDFTPRALCPEHRRRARPLVQPEGIEPERRRQRHPFKRWLEMLRGKERAGEGAI